MRARKAARFLRRASVSCACALAFLLTVSAPISTVAFADESGDLPVRTDLIEFSVRNQLADISDPIEGWNRRVYAFNTSFDRRLFLPAVNGYRAVTPDPVETGIWNFFLNVSEVRTFVHSLLQLKPRSAGITLGRLVVNSTLGVGGLMDPATSMGLARLSEDFGQTLGRYGMPDGPYLVLPLFGPSNLRDTTGMAGDYALSLVGYEIIGLSDNDLWPVRWTLAGLRGLSSRANTAFRYHETGSPFEYEMVRYLYTQMRELEIEK